MDNLIKPKGKHLYKYGSAKDSKISYLESIILKNELYFPRPSELNDPAEGRPKLSNSPKDKFITFIWDSFILDNPNLNLTERVFHYKIIENMVNKSEGDELRNDLCKKMYNELDKNNRIYSLSKRWNNMSLWANYADSHKGYCLEFFNDGIFKTAFEVNYTDNITPIDVTNMPMSFIFFFNKKNDWINEEEIRIVTPSLIQPPIKIEPPELLASIILGKDMSIKNEDLIRSWVNKRIPTLELNMM
ncbi:MAG: DUF2971 domain-containing protein [bacterium]|nr:DUF2971 domain-containing protein [bacterium]